MHVKGRQTWEDELAMRVRSPRSFKLPPIPYTTIITTITIIPHLGWRRWTKSVLSILSLISLTVFLAPHEIEFYSSHVFVDRSTAGNCSDTIFARRPRDSPSVQRKLSDIRHRPLKDSAKGWTRSLPSCRFWLQDMHTQCQSTCLISCLPSFFYQPAGSASPTPNSHLPFCKFCSLRSTRVQNCPQWTGLIFYNILTILQKHEHKNVFTS